nr:hypothetical protein [Tanacetum cinerariifolium]
MGEGSAMPTDPHYISTILQSSSSQPQKTQKPRKPKRKDTQVPSHSDPMENVVDEAVHKELGDRLVRAATTAFSLKAEQDSGNTLQSDEDTLKLNELMALCTNLQTRVLEFEKTETTQQNEIASLKRRVKKLERRNRRIDAIDQDEEITLVNVQDDAKSATTKITAEEVTLAQALEALKTLKPKDKGKGIMVEEPVKPKKKDQIRIDEEAARRLQAKFAEEERLPREKERESSKRIRSQYCFN